MKKYQLQNSNTTITKGDCIDLLLNIIEEASHLEGDKALTIRVAAVGKLISLIEEVNTNTNDITFNITL